MRSSDASDDRLKTLPPAPTQLGAQAPGLKGLPSLLRQVLLPSTDRGGRWAGVVGWVGEGGVGDAVVVVMRILLDVVVYLP